MLLGGTVRTTKAISLGHQALAAGQFFPSGTSWLFPYETIAHGGSVADGATQEHLVPNVYSWAVVER